MPQAISPNRLQADSPYKDNIALTNDNFDKVVSAVNDMGFKNYGTGTYGVQTLAAGAFVTFTLNIVDTKNQYVTDSLAVIPRWQIFVDTNSDYGYIWPDGSSLTSDQRNIDFSWIQTRVVPTGSPTNTKAVLYALLRNNGASSHDYYVSVDLYFGNSPQTGLFR